MNFTLKYIYIYILWRIPKAIDSKYNRIKKEKVQTFSNIPHINEFYGSSPKILARGFKFRSLWISGGLKSH